MKSVARVHSLIKITIIFPTISFNKHASCDTARLSNTISSVVSFIKQKHAKHLNENKKKKMKKYETKASRFICEMKKGQKKDLFIYIFLRMQTSRRAIFITQLFCESRQL